MDWTPLIFVGLGVGILAAALFISRYVSDEEWTDGGGGVPDVSDFLG